ncbi:MAG: hypothetical protein L0Z62_36305 [Gemmataceae bacterium]|nr:hypothetical protein [Gemmataceae bacterium]
MSVDALEPIRTFYQAVQSILEFEQSVLNEWAREAIPRDLGKKRQELLRNLRQLRGDTLRAGVEAGSTPHDMTKLLNAILDGCQQLQGWDAKLLKQWPGIPGRRRSKAKAEPRNVVESACQTHSRLADALYPALSELADLLLLKEKRQQPAKKWEFPPGGYCYRGSWHRLPVVSVKLLKLFDDAESNILSGDQISRMDGARVSKQTVYSRVSNLRKSLKKSLKLSTDPIQSVGEDAWKLIVP